MFSIWPILGQQGGRLEILERPTTVRLLADRKRATDVEKLYKDSHAALIFTKTVIERLGCDDLAMLPEATSLIPFVELLIRFRPLMSPTTEDEWRVLERVLWRCLLARFSTQRDTLSALKIVDSAQSAEEAVAGLERRLGSAKAIGREVADSLRRADAVTDRHTLLLYWLVRLNKARDFSYESNLPVEQRARLVERFGERSRPKCSLIARFILRNSTSYRIRRSKAYGVEGRGRASRHQANNIGNITYISRALNAFDTGVGSQPLAIGDEQADNLNRHVLARSDRKGPGDLLQRLLASGPLTSARTNKFEKFCRMRQDAIAAGFVQLIADREEARIIRRIEPEARAFNRSLQDKIRGCDYDNRIEDALPLWERTFKLQERQPSKGHDCDGQVGLRLFVRQNDHRLRVSLKPDGIEFEEVAGNPLCDQLRATAAGRLLSQAACATCGRTHSRTRLILPVDEEYAEATALALTVAAGDVASA